MRRPYVVSWTVEVDADSPRDAALTARAIQMAVTHELFDVFDDFGQSIQIDLSYKPPGD